MFGRKYKRITRSTLFCIIFSQYLAAQNLVPNYSFEQYSGIPTCSNQFNNVDTWYNATSNTPDYISCLAQVDNPQNCFDNQLANTQNNWLGFQTPHTGCAYAAIHLYSPGSETREYIGVKLSSPMVVGETYNLTLYFSLCDNADYRCNGLGLLLSLQQPTADHEISAEPQVYEPNINSDSVNWTEFTTTYTADQPYQYLTLGNFFSYSDPRFSVVGPFNIYTNNNVLTGSYYIDDVSITPVPLTKPFLGNDTTICSNNKLTLTSNVSAQSYQWSTGDTTKSITVTDSGMYWLKIQSFDQIQGDTILVYTKPAPVVDLGGTLPICTDTLTVLLNAGNEVSYLWSTTDTTQTITAKSYGDYSVTVTGANGCVTNDLVHIINDCPTCIGKIVVFPNPASNSFSISFLSAEKFTPVKYKISDVLGKLVKEVSSDTEKGNNRITIDCSMLSSGKYILSIKAPCGMADAEITKVND